MSDGGRRREDDHPPSTVREPRIDLDPYAPQEMARRVARGGVAKAALDTPTTLILAGLAGAFIGLGGLLTTVAGTATGMGFGPTRLLMGVAFSLGLILVVVGGAELFTGNNLLVMAWASGEVGSAALLRNWGLVYAGNLVGALATALGVHLSGIGALGDGALAASALATAAAKLDLTWGEAFLRGAFANALVCLALWLATAARSTTDKILAIVFPITAFVAAGFEHSVANMYLIPAGLLVHATEGGMGGGAGALGVGGAGLTWTAFVWDNLVPVTLGNIVGGSLMVGLVYWAVYLRKRPGTAGPT